MKAGNITRRKINITLVIAFIIMFSPIGRLRHETGTASANRDKSVLVLYSYADTLPAHERFNANFRPMLTKGGIHVHNQYYEYLDLGRNKSAEYRKGLADYLVAKYRGRNIDLIITLHSFALDFLLNEGKNIHPNTPLLGLLAPRSYLSYASQRSMLLIPRTIDLTLTLRHALQIFPSTKKVVFISGADKEGNDIEMKAKKSFRPWDQKLEFTYTGDMSMDDILKLVSNLTGDTIIFFSLMFADNSGMEFVPIDALRTISSRASAPIFSIYDTHLGAGILGGAMLNMEEAGEKYALLALKMIGGESISGLDTKSLSPAYRPMYDWKQMERWNVSENSLPSGNVVINRPSTIVSQYRSYAMAAAVIIIAQSIMVGLLIRQVIIRRRIEASLRSSEEHFRSIVEQASEAILIFDVDWDRFIDANRNAEIMFGCGRDQLLSSGPMRFLIPERSDTRSIQEIFKANNQRALAGENVASECLIKNARDETIRCEIRFTCLQSAWRNLIRISIIDITKMRMAVETIRKKEREIAALVDNTPDMIFRYDRGCRCIFANRAVEKECGLKPESMIGKTIREIGAEPLDRIEFNEKIIRTVFETGREISFEISFPSADGVKFFLSLCVPEFGPDCKVETVLFIHRDITDRRRAEQELEKSERRYRLISDNMRDTVWLMDMSLNITWMSPSVHRSRGFSIDEMASMQLDKQLAPASHKKIIFLINENLVPENLADKNREITVSAELEFNKKDGSKQWEDTLITMLRDADGKPSGFLCVGRDISERRQAEEIVQKSLKEKEALLRELYHRTKNNMQVICAMMELQSEYVKDEKVIGLFRKMENRIQTMSLVHQLLYQARDLSRINMKKYIFDLIRLLIDSYQVPLHRITIEVNAPDIFVLIDTAVPCGLILNELLSNSLKHAFPDIRNGIIHISFKRIDDDFIELKVSDNGIGFPTDFDSKTHVKMGLQSVKAIGEHQLKGTVDIMSDTGLTCTVKFKDDTYPARI